MGNPPKPDDAVLVCKRIGDMGEPPVRSRLKKCDLCASQIWVAELSPPVDHYWCTRCAADEITPDVEVAKVTPEQLSDLAAYFNRGRH